MSAIIMQQRQAICGDYKNKYHKWREKFLNWSQFCIYRIALSPGKSYRIRSEHLVILDQ